jgi:predicted nucleic acid-binding protein
MQPRPKVVTYVDSGLLIAAATGRSTVAEPALNVLTDPEREFASSRFVQLEVLPKAIYYRNEDEAAFYRTFFEEKVTRWAEPVEAIVDAGYQEACAAGLSALDALHIAAAALVGADELVTIERREKAIHRTRSVRVVTVQPASNSA